MLALIEMKRRKLQFGLVTGVVVLISYLIIMVTGLGLGLNERAGTGLLALNGGYLAYASNSNLSVIRSRLTEAHVASVAAAPGVEQSTPVGYVAVVVEHGAGESDTAATLGVAPGSFAEPEVVEGRQLAGPAEVLIDRAWVRLTGTGIGETLALPAGFETRDFTVVGVVEQGYFFFQPTVYVSLGDWQTLAYQGDRSQRPAASVVLVQGEGLDGARGDGWQIVTKQEGFRNIEGVQAQQSTVNALRYMGLLIGTLVIGVFFYVITLQKVALLGILKAIGASGMFLVTQGLLQVLLVALAGTVLSVGLAVLTETTLLSSDTVPIMFTTSSLITSSASVVIGGLIGAALSVRQVAAIDPIIAMQQQ
jgi:putative ABC transport system permease protein